MKITTGTPEVMGINRKYPGLVDVRVPLEPTPNRAWSDIFLRRPNGYGHPLSMHHPTIIGDMIEVGAPPDEVEQYMERIIDRVRLTNEDYDRDIQPQIDARREAAAHEKQRQEQMLDQAQERLAGWQTKS